MSAQVDFVPPGYTQDAIAPAIVIIMSTDPNFENVVTLADMALGHQHYDELAEEDLEGILASMQFPS